MSALHRMSEIYRLAAVARGCRVDLNDSASLLEKCLQAVEAVSLTVVAQATHAFVPHGVSVALLLAQSHLIVSTWPEYGTATVDLVVCADDRSAHAAWDELKAYLNPSSAEIAQASVVLTMDDGLLHEQTRELLL